MDNVVRARGISDYYLLFSKGYSLDKLDTFKGNLDEGTMYVFLKIPKRILNQLGVRYVEVGSWDVVEELLKRGRCLVVYDFEDSKKMSERFFDYMVRVIGYSYVFSSLINELLPKLNFLSSLLSPDQKERAIIESVNEVWKAIKEEFDSINFEEEEEFKELLKLKKNLIKNMEDFYKRLKEITKRVGAKIEVIELRI